DGADNSGSASANANSMAVATAGVAEPLVLMVDHHDSFVHMLGACFRAAGTQVRTVRPEALEQALAGLAPSLVVLSPGPGRPADFALSRTLELCLQRDLPVFGVCLGLQGIVEYFGGTLRTLATPMHGKSSLLMQAEGPLFAGLQTP